MSYHSAQDPEENLPEWLKALRRRQEQDEPAAQEPAADHTAAEEPEPTPAEESPAPREPVEPAAAQSAPDAESEPEWLREIRKRYKPSTGSIASPSPAPQQPVWQEPAAEEPVWQPEPAEPELSDTQPVSPLSAQTEASPFEESLPSADELPDWLRPEAAEDEKEERADTEPIEATPAFTISEASEIAPGEIPSWLQAIRPNEFPIEDTRSGDMLPGGDIPGIEETAGPLAGLMDVLPAQPGAIHFDKPSSQSSRLDITESHSMHAAALGQMLRDEAKPVEDEARRVALPTRVLNLVISGVLLLAIAIPLLTQRQNSTRPDTDLFPESAAIFNVIDVLPAGAPVLVAFEVQPASYGEMRPVITAVFSHLLDRQVRLVFISTQPTGPTLAERVLFEMFPGNPLVATGEYSNLGYLSGGMAALRSFLTAPRAAVISTTGQNPWAAPALEGVGALSDFALVLVVSSSTEDAQAWIEQGAAHLPTGLMAITSAQANPLLRVYLQGNPLVLRGLVSGVQGAALYERFRGQVGLGSLYWDAYSFGLGAFVLSILIGGLYGRVIHMRPEKASTRAA